MHLPLALALLGIQAQALDLPKKFLSPRPKPAAVVAKVNGDPIRAQDLESYLWDWRAFEAAQDLTSYQMVAAEARRQKVSVTDAEVQQELDKNLEQLRKELRPGQTLQGLLLERGFPKSRLYLRVKTERLLNKLVLKAFDPKPFVRVSTIVVRPLTERATDVAQALQRADDAYNALKNGEPWGDVLARHTDDTPTLQNGGLLGWREIRAFPPTVQQEMATLKPGGFTKPAQTANGIQIFRLEAVGAGATGAQLEELRNAYLQGTRQKFFEDLRARTKIEILIGK